MTIQLNISQLNPQFINSLRSTLVPALANDDERRSAHLLDGVEAMKEVLRRYLAKYVLTQQQKEDAFYRDIVPEGYADYQVLVNPNSTHIHVVPVRADMVRPMCARVRLTAEELERCDIDPDLLWLEHCIAWAATADCQPYELERVADVLLERVAYALGVEMERTPYALRCHMPKYPIKSIELDELTVHR